MQTDFKTILLNILEIIGYINDKETFTTRFLDLCLREALVNYMELLSMERKKELQQILLENNPVKFQEQIEPYITTEEYKNILRKSSEKLFQEYLDKISPTLTELQKNNLNTYFDSLASDQTAVASQNI